MKDIRPLNLLQRIKYRYLEWSWDRVLKRSGCSNWISYFRKNDLDFDIDAKTVKQRFAGYPYVVKISNARVDLCFHPLYGVTRSVETLNNWCLQNCSKKYRIEWLKISDHLNDDWYIVDSFYVNYTLEPYAFIGFKDERDFLIFTLKWT